MITRAIHVWFGMVLCGIAAGTAVGQSDAPVPNDSPPLSRQTSGPSAPASRDFAGEDLDRIPTLRWMSLDGRPPGTYAEYLARHPLGPAWFSDRWIATPAGDEAGLRGDEPGIAILVDADLYPSVRTGLVQYVADLTLEGYAVVVEAVSGGTPQEIKAWLAAQHDAGCEGAVLVGDITAAWFAWQRDEVTWDTFPCDLYYMDLDGYWEDSSADGIFDVHTAGDGDEAPEIYVARMYTPTLSWDTEANLFNNYVDKMHAYRVGELTVPWRGLEYIDEPWYGYDYFLHLMYGDRVARHDFGHLTTGAGYLEQLGQGYHYAHVSAHSGGSVHFFGTHPTESATYAHVYVYSPSERPAQLLMGSDDGIKVWLNGSVVYNRDYYWYWWERGWEADQFATQVDLASGWNRLLCKVSQRDDEFRFSVRLVDLDDVPFTDLSYQTDDPDVHGWDPHSEPGSHIGTWLLNGLYENAEIGSRLSQDYLGGEADVRPSTGDAAACGVWERVTRHGAPFDFAEYYREYYGPGGSTTSQNIQDLDPPVFFYNLFACGSGRFTEPDNLGGSCIFNTSYGLITVASSKSGSMVNYPYYNGPLGDGETFGRAFHAWWVAQAPYNHGLRGWIYGMILSGDPTLSLFPPDRDCNGNGVPDDQDIAGGTSEDCNGNGVPDECDVAAGMDCNGNGVPDECDITDGTSPDCNLNGLPDECDLADGTSADCNGNDTPDECDIADGVSADCNENGVPDECDLVTDGDCNENGIPDDCDIAAGTSRDCNVNGVPDECDIADGTSADDDGDGIPDECEGPVRYVNADAPPGGNGLFWESAFNDLQVALATVVTTGGEELWVAAGTYTPAEPGGDRAATFQLINGVRIYGGFAGWEAELAQRDPARNRTILSGDLNRDDRPDFERREENSFHVVTASGCDESAVLDGFTITAGNADTSTYPNGWGGGTYMRNGSPLIANCSFALNSSRYLGGGMYNDGGAPTLTSCTFVGNVAGTHGGGIYNYLTACTLANCVFSGNASTEHGGAVHNARSSVTLANCSFSQNAAARGGAVHCESSCDVLITNCIFWDDWAESGPEIALAVGSAPSALTVSYSDVAGGFDGVSVDGGCSLTWGDGNLDVDPLFADADGSDGVPGTADDDLAVTDASPCIDAGDSQAVPPDAADLDGDADVSELTPLDRAGRARFVDHYLVDDTGLAFPPGYPAVVDLGAYEYPFCFGDLNADGVVGLEDLAILIANYGSAGDMQYADGDLDGDGDVDLADLSTLLPLYRTICE